MNLLFITSTIMAVGSLMDGISTIDFLKSPTLVEADPIMVWIFGTDRPSPKTVILRGGAAIAFEIAAAFLVSHFWYPAVYVFAAQQLAQACVHVYEYFRNEGLLAASSPPL
jgi:hypothetical protein